jgi:hypothetical protein
VDVSKPKGNTQSFENEHRSVLFAQVIHGKPRMGINKDGFLEVLGKSRKDRKVFLGDVAKAMLHSLGSHETPIFTDEPNWDEQRWELTCKSNELNIKITSSHYWGFGLFSRCFYNKIEIEGPLSVRSRCVHDMVSTLGRNPWEAVRIKSFERVTRLKISEHFEMWNTLIQRAKNEMNEQILRLEDKVRKLRGVNENAVELLRSADLALEEARTALSDRNAPAVERALSRASNSIIQADPKTELLTTNILFDED